MLGARLHRRCTVAAPDPAALVLACLSQSRKGFCGRAGELDVRQGRHDGSEPTGVDRNR